MRRRGHTLIELMVALAAAAFVALVAGRLLFNGLESWRRQADAYPPVRQSIQTLDALAVDLAAQPNFPSLPAPLEAFELGKGSTRQSFFLAGEDFRPRSVCWYLEGDSAGLWSLRRYEADAEATAEGLPSNAAEQFVLSAQAEPEGEGAKALQTVSQRMCTGLVTLSLEPATSTGIPQLLLENLSPEAQARLSDGATLSSLPERLRIRSSRPLP